MKIRIGDRVRIKSTGKWGTVVRYGNRRLFGFVCGYVIRLDCGLYLVRTKQRLEKLPRYRGIPQAWDMVTAMRHLQEYAK